MKRKPDLILRFLKGNTHFFLLALLFSMLNTILNAMIPQVIRVTVDSVLGTDPLPDFLKHFISEETVRGNVSVALSAAAALIILIALCHMISNYNARTFTAKGSEHFVKDLRDALFGHIQKLPFEWHTRHQTGEIIQRCTSDVEVVKNFITNQLLEVFRICFLILFSVSVMLSMNVKITLIAVAFIPIIILYSGYFYGKIGQKFLDADEAEGRLSTQVQENLTGVRVVRAFGRERYEVDRFQEKNEEFADMWIRMGRIMSLYWGTGDLITGLQIMIVISVGAAAAVYGEITLGEFLALVSYNSTLIWPVRGLGRVLSEMSKAGVSIERLVYIFNSKTEEDVPDACTPPMNQDIHFDHVSFGYDQNQPVLKDVSFTVPAGKTFAILGGTGSGKSTLVHLINSLYELKENEGSIRIGDTDIRKIQKAYLRRHVGLVLQEPFLYSRTIQENIGITLEKPTLNEIRQACEIACVDSAIDSFANGYETVVGERGVTLSGGQKQRVAIARMLMQKAEIMIFDDSLSAVDTETDIRIRMALKERMQQATVILISHRITTLMQADTIMVLTDGRIAEMGSHEELMQLGGTYRRIYDIQMGQTENHLKEDGRK